MSSLRSARSILAQGPGQVEFCSGFPEFDERIRSAFKPVDAFGDAWRRFSDTFQEFKRADGKDVVSSEKPPNEFFNLGTWERTMAMHWYRALPNYLVGLGLCFTFLGVVAVISLAAASLQDSKSAADQTEALRQLLAAASTKFSTSLAGVAASVAYSWYFRWRQMHVDRSIVTFARDLNARVFVLNANWLLLQIREENQRHTGCLETMATNIGVEVGTKLSQASEIMAEAIKALDKTVQGMSIQMGAKTDSMKSAIDSLSDGIIETTSSDLAKLVESAISALDNTLRGHLENVARSLENTRVEIDATRDAFSEVTANAEAVRDEFSTLSDEIKTRSEEVCEMLLNVEGDLEKKLLSAGTAAESIKSAFHNAAEDATSMSSIGAELRSLCGALNGAAASVQKAGALWQEMGNDFNKLTTENGKASETVRASTESLRLHWDAQGHRIAEIDTHLAQTISALQNYFDGYSLRLRDYTTQMDAQLGRAVSSFGATLQTLGDAPERFVDAGSQLQTAAQNLVVALEPLHKISGLADSISRSAEASPADIPAQTALQP
jgi:rubrerythrin